MLALVCAGGAASPCFSSNSLGQLCKQLRNALTPGSRVTQVPVPKAPASCLGRTVLPPALPAPPAAPFQLPCPVAEGTPLPVGKNCLSHTNLSSGSHKLGKLHTDLQICSSSASLICSQIVTDGSDRHAFYPSVVQLEERPLSFPAACAGALRLPLVPFHLHGTTPCPAMQHISAHNKVISAFPSWQDQCHTMGGRLVLPLTSGCFTQGKEQNKKS